MRPTGRVRLVVLNYEGGSDLVRCVEHLLALDWPSDELELVVVDNASTDGSADEVARRFPTVRVHRLDRNRGFPANNVALRELDGVRYVGLVNNDAFVEPGYLTPLVQALDDDPGLGAACPLMVFEQQFTEVEIEVAAARPGRGDPRALGLKVAGVRVDGDDVSRRASVVEGGYGAEVGASGSYTWTGERAVLRVPVPREGARSSEAALLVSALSTKQARFRTAAGDIETTVGPVATWVAVPLGGAAFDVVNNAGSIVLDDGYGADRGYGRRDLDAFSEPDDVFAWCGGAVLLRPDYVRAVGLFEERFFLYYEDTDLSWRGQAQGWRYRYVPASRVRHRHAGTSVAGSARFHYFTERNRLLMLVRNAPAPMARQAVWRFVTQTYDAARRDVLGALVQRRRPNVVPVWRRTRAFAGFVRQLPAALWARRRLRRRQTVADSELLAGLTTTSS